MDIADHYRTAQAALGGPDLPPLRQPRRGHREWQGDPDVLVRTQRLAAELIARVEHLLQQFAGMLAKALALRRQLRRIDAAVDQIEAEPGLQRLDAPAERGLRRVAPLGRSGEI